MEREIERDSESEYTYLFPYTLVRVELVKAKSCTLYSRGQMYYHESAAGRIVVQFLKAVKFISRKIRLSLNNFVSISNTTTPLTR